MKLRGTENAESYNSGNMPREFLDSGSRRLFRKHLLCWFDREKRSLPWRGERDPYRILVSEIMLQQTRVAVVKDRYQTFLSRFPDVERLARAKEESVLAAWSGLGYYRRARALHAAARHIRKNGGFPASAAQLAELSGIGRYTAAAVASIAFDEPVAVVDGNVKRVLVRLTGRSLSGDSFWRAAQELLDARRPGDFNQAMMELGATVCLPGQPLCSRCPVISFCASSQVSGFKHSLPNAKPSTRRKKGVLAYLLIRRNGAVFLQQRPAHLSLMPGMWELPQTRPRSKSSRNPVMRLKHSITTTDYTVLVFAGSTRRVRKGLWLRPEEANRLALTGLARKILKHLDLLN